MTTAHATYIPTGASVDTQGNCSMFPVANNEIVQICDTLFRVHSLPLKTIVASDEQRERGVFRIYYVFGVPRENAYIVPFIELRDTVAFPSITKAVFEAAGYEREIYTMFGLTPEGHPDLRTLILHDNWPSNVYPLRKDFAWNTRPAMANPEEEYVFNRVAGEGVYEIPVGPVHAGIIEPGHFRFSVMGEEIISLEPRLGYVHKGSEKLFEVLPLADTVKLSERISGDSSFHHSLAFCQAMEILTGIEVTPRAGTLRVVFAELERLANHLGDMGAIMLDTGFSFGGSNGSRLRELVMQLNERLTGSRFLRGVNQIGGVSKDISSADVAAALQDIKLLQIDFTEMLDIALGRISLLNRLSGTGTLPATAAAHYGVLGVAGRAVGRAYDARVDYPYAQYSRMPVEIAIEQSGDVQARFTIRAKEVVNSIAIITHALQTLPAGAIASAHMPTVPQNKMAINVVEGWRGDIVYVVMTNTAGEISRVKVRDVSFLNWQAVPQAVTNDMMPDFPLINKSFNLSYSGNDL